jgi:hypothetical protein
MHAMGPVAFFFPFQTRASRINRSIVVALACWPRANQKRPAVQSQAKPGPAAHKKRGDHRLGSLIEIVRAAIAGRPSLAWQGRHLCCLLLLLK